MGLGLEAFGEAQTAKLLLALLISRSLAGSSVAIPQLAILSHDSHEIATRWSPAWTMGNLGQGFLCLTMVCNHGCGEFSTGCCVYRNWRMSPPVLLLLDSRKLLGLIGISTKLVEFWSFLVPYRNSVCDLRYT